MIPLSILALTIITQSYILSALADKDSNWLYDMNAAVLRNKRSIKFSESDVLNTFNSTESSIQETNINSDMNSSSRRNECYRFMICCSPSCDCHSCCCCPSCCNCGYICCCDANCGSGNDRSRNENGNTERNDNRNYKNYNNISNKNHNSNQNSNCNRHYNCNRNCNCNSHSDCNRMCYTNRNLCPRCCCMYPANCCMCRSNNCMCPGCYNHKICFFCIPMSECNSCMRNCCCKHNRVDNCSNESRKVSPNTRSDTISNNKVRKVSLDNQISKNRKTLFPRTTNQVSKETKTKNNFDEKLDSRNYCRNLKKTECEDYSY